MSEFEFFKVAMTAEHVATVTIARPPVNAFTQEVYKEMQDLFGRTDEIVPDARAIILTGEGKHFCGGNDLTEFQTMNPDNAAARMLEVRTAFWAIRDCPVPVIAAVAGVAVGTGLAIAASADMVVASDDAKFSLPEIQVGAMGGARHAMRLAPLGVVRRMHFTADMVPVQELQPYGGIHAVVPRESLLDEAHELASRIVRHSPIAIRIAKRSLNGIESMEFKEGYAFEQGLTGELSGYDDAKEAVNAFFERRDPVYTGR